MTNIEEYSYFNTYKSFRVPLLVELLSSDDDRISSLLLPLPNDLPALAATSMIGTADTSTTHMAISSAPATKDDTVNFADIFEGETRANRKNFLFANEADESMWVQRVANQI